MRYLATDVMSHFHSLRLKQHKGLKSADLHELGRINVVCGPNNSGKTTILECIADEKLHVFGLSLDLEATLRVRERAMAGRTWNSEHMTVAYPILLTEVAGGQAIWFADQANTFWTRLVSIWQKKFGNSVPGDQERLQQAVRDEFRAVPSIVLIPAKRRLESSNPVQSSEPVQPLGSGVLNFLFYAKNQDKSDQAQQHFDKIAKGFREITGGYDFDIVLKPGNIIELRFRSPDAPWVQADDCGLGLRDLLTMLYFGIAAEHDVILIEEPENHLHPEIQRRLIKHLRNNSAKQFFLSTHSSVFLNTQFTDRVFTCRMTDSVQVTNATSRATALTELGYSIADNLVSDLVILCEGPKDKLVLDEFFQKMGLLERFSIKVWPLGGDIMDQLDLSVFQEAHQLVALIDGDPGSSAVRNRFIKKCEELKIPITRLERYSMENYFSLKAIAAVMKGQMPLEVTVLDSTIPVSAQLGFEVKKIGGRIAKEMTMEDIKGTDLDGFLQQVAKLATQSRAM